MIWVFDTATGRKRAELRGHQGRIHAMGFAGDNKSLLSAGEDMTFRFWEIETGKSTRQFPINGHSRTDKYIAGKPTQLMAAVFTPDLRTAVTSGVLDERINIWDLTIDTARRRTIRAAKNLGASLAMTPDGLMFASASADALDPEGDDATIRLWSRTTGAQILRLETGGRMVRSLAISGDGKTLVSGMDDTTAMIWDVSAAYAALKRTPD